MSDKYLKKQKITTVTETSASSQELICKSSTLAETSETILHCNMSEEELKILMYRMDKHLMELEVAIERDYDEDTSALVMSYAVIE